MSRPIVASQRYTLAAVTSNRWANSAADSLNCLRSLATDVPVGLIDGAAAALACVRLLGAARSCFLRTADIRSVILKSVDWPAVGADLRRAAGRGFFRVPAEAARLPA